MDSFNISIVATQIKKEIIFKWYTKEFKEI